MNTHSLQLGTLGSRAVPGSGGGSLARKVLGRLRLLAVRLLRLNRVGAKPLTEDGARWAYLASIRRIGPTL